MWRLAWGMMEETASEHCASAFMGKALWICQWQMGHLQLFGGGEEMESLDMDK